MTGTTVDEGLMAYLSVDSGLYALIGGRIYPFRFPDTDTVMPCMTMQRVSTPRELTHDDLGATGTLAYPRFQFNVYAETALSAKTITDTLRAALNGKTGNIGYQLETATVTGTITLAGNARVIVTCTGMTGTPITTSVAVLLGDTAAQVAGKIRTALGNVANIAAFLTVGGAGTTITLTKTSPGDSAIANLNIDIDNDTCTGLTPARTSVNTFFASATIRSAQVQDERPAYVPEIRLYTSINDYVIWHEE